MRDANGYSDGGVAGAVPQQRSSRSTSSIYSSLQCQTDTGSRRPARLPAHRWQSGPEARGRACPTRRALPSHRPSSPALSGSIDYYHIRIDNEITNGLSIADIVGSCLSSGNPTVCSFIHRNNANFGLNGPNVASGGYVTQTSINIASGLVSGVDVQLNYKQQLGWLDHWAPTSPALIRCTMRPRIRPNRSRTAPGCMVRNCLTVDPRWRHNMRLTWTMPWDTTFAATWRYIGRVGYDGNTPQFGGAPRLILVNGTIPATAISTSR